MARRPFHVLDSGPSTEVRLGGRPVRMAAAQVDLALHE